MVCAGNEFDDIQVGDTFSVLETIADTASQHGRLAEQASRGRLRPHLLWRSRHFWLSVCHYSWLCCWAGLHRSETSTSCSEENGLE